MLSVVVLVPWILSIEQNKKKWKSNQDYYKGNCSGSHEVTKAQRIDLPAIALAQARRVGRGLEYQKQVDILPIASWYMVV